MSVTSIDYCKSSRGMFGQRSSIQQVRTSANSTDYNNVPYLSTSTINIIQSKLLVKSLSNQILGFTYMQIEW